MKLPLPTVIRPSSCLGDQQHRTVCASMPICERLCGNRQKPLAEQLHRQSTEKCCSVLLSLSGPVAPKGKITNNRAATVHHTAVSSEWLYWTIDSLTLCQCHYGKLQNHGCVPEDGTVTCSGALLLWDCKWKNKNNKQHGSQNPSR